MAAKVGGRAALKGISRKHVDVEGLVPDTVFRLQELSGTARDQFEVGIFRDEEVIVDGKPESRRKIDPMYLRARLVALCLVGEDGQRLYADDEIPMLSDDLSSATLGKLFEAAQKLNGLEEKAAETAAKNSPAAEAAASTSGSRSH